MKILSARKAELRNYAGRDLMHISRNFIKLGGRREQGLTIESTAVAQTGFNLERTLRRLGRPFKKLGEAPLVKFRTLRLSAVPLASLQILLLQS